MDKNTSSVSNILERAAQRLGIPLKGAQAPENLSSDMYTPDTSSGSIYDAFQSDPDASGIAFDLDYDASETETGEARDMGLDSAAESTPLTEFYKDLEQFADLDSINHEIKIHQNNPSSKPVEEPVDSVTTTTLIVSEKENRPATILAFALGQLEKISLQNNPEKNTATKTSEQVSAITPLSSQEKSEAIVKGDTASDESNSAHDVTVLNEDQEVDQLGNYSTDQFETSTNDYITLSDEHKFAVNGVELDKYPKEYAKEVTTIAKRSQWFIDQIKKVSATLGVDSSEVIGRIELLIEQGGDFNNIYSVGCNELFGNKRGANPENRVKTKAELDEERRLEKEAAYRLMVERARARIKSPEEMQRINAEKEKIAGMINSVFEKPKDNFLEFDGMLKEQSLSKQIDAAVKDHHAEDVEKDIRDQIIEKVIGRDKSSASYFAIVKDGDVIFQGNIKHLNPGIVDGLGEIDNSVILWGNSKIEIDNLVELISNGLESKTGPCEPLLDKSKESVAIKNDEDVDKEIQKGMHRLGITESRPVQSPNADFKSNSLIDASESRIDAPANEESIRVNPYLKSFYSRLNKNQVFQVEKLIDLYKKTIGSSMEFYIYESSLEKPDTAENKIPKIYAKLQLPTNKTHLVSIDENGSMLHLKGESESTRNSHIDSGVLKNISFESIDLARTEIQASNKAVSAANRHAHSETKTTPEVNNVAMPITAKTHSMNF